jgi:predicted aldo/keto reductase-like oxidoreductase
MRSRQPTRCAGAKGRLWVALLCVAALGIGCSGGGSSQEQKQDAASLGVKHYNTLGRTGLEVSDIGFGAGSATDPAVIQYALDLGINYFDTAEGYAAGRCESAIGEVAAAHRDKMVICTKLEMDANTTQEDVFTRLDACLKRLQTDYVDILMIHGGSSEALVNPEIFAAFDTLKAQGKIHFAGVSHHGPNIAAELRPLIAENKVDVILCSYDPIGEPELTLMLDEARAKGIGLVAMKVLASARDVELEEFNSGEYPFHQAALRWALMESGMQSILVTIRMMDEVDEYVAVSGAGADA